MPRGRRTGDQLTGGTKDVNPHYRTVNVPRSSPDVGFPINYVSQVSGSASLVDVFSIDTGIAQNVPAGRGGKQIVMELLGVSIRSSSNVDAQYAMSPTFMDAVNARGPNYFNGSNWATQAHIESLLCSTAPLATTTTTGVVANYAANSSSSTGQVATVDASNPTILFRTGETKALHYGYQLLKQQLLQLQLLLQL